MLESKITEVVAAIRKRGSFQHGAHTAESGQMCINEAIAWAAGEKHSDVPSCVPSDLQRFLASFHDSAATDKQRWDELSPRLGEILRAPHDDEVAHQRGLLAIDWLLRVYTPAWLRLVPSLVGHADALAKMPMVTDANAGTFEPLVNAAEAAAGYAARDPARDPVGYVARAAARAAAGYAARDPAEAAAEAAAGYAARDSAWDPAGYAAWAAAWVAARAAARVAARVAAGAAAGDLKPTADTLRASALDLLDRMLAVRMDDAGTTS